MPQITSRLLALLVGVAALVLAGCSSQVETPAQRPADAVSGTPLADTETSGPPLRIDLRDGVTVGSPVTAANVLLTGGESAIVSVVTELGGEITSVAGPEGAPAFRFPVYRNRERAAGAVLTVDPAGRDVLDPGAGDFSFGADLTLDEVTSGTTRDNGDNVLQRGLFDQGAQFKLQVDHHRPSCSFEGVSGRVDVWAEHDLTPGAWYRLTCSRIDDDFTLSIDALDAAGGSSSVETVSQQGEVGTLEFGPATPLTLGGKIAPDGGLANATDQFNGAVGRVFVNIP